MNENESFHVIRRINRWERDGYAGERVCGCGCEWLFLVSKGPWCWEGRSWNWVCKVTFIFWCGGRLIRVLLEWDNLLLSKRVGCVLCRVINNLHT